MNASNPLASDSQLKQQERSRKRKALLAGGVVLGLGAAVTLAAWSDDVFAGGTFDTGAFELQGNVVSGDVESDTGWNDYDGGPAPEGTASLGFVLEATNMSPNQTVYAPLSIATDSDTSLDGNFVLTDVSSAGAFATALSYSIYTTEGHGTNCTPDGTLGTAWSSGAANESTTTSGPELPVDAERGNAQNLCIAVTLGAQSQVEGIIAALAPGAPSATTVTWRFTGTSSDD